jgi:UDPglucose 6-dehydrogenase
MKVTVIGTGYVGLTTGVCLAYLGHEVTCVDHDEEKVARLQAGKCPIYEPFLEELMALSRKRLSFTASYESSVPGAEIIFIAVGTPSLPDGSPNLTYLRQAASEIGRTLNSENVVIVNKSTVPIGSANWVESIVRESYRARMEGSQKTNYFLASNPEFLREGSAIQDTLYTDRIVIGAESPLARQLLQELYRPILEQTFQAPDFLPRPEGFGAVPLISATLASAELIKYAANAFLSLKISFINEIGELAEKVGADIKDISKGIGLDTRIGTRFLQSGLGWGGSCFGKDTAALVSTGKEYDLEMKIVEAARAVNYRQRTRVVTLLQEELKILKGRTIGILGAAFKPNTDDLRDAPCLEIGHLLKARGANIRVHDPIALERARIEWSNQGFQFETHLENFFQELDAVILVTEWSDYRDLNWSQIKAKMNQAIVLDGRNFLDSKELKTLGFTFRSIG